MGFNIKYDIENIGNIKKASISIKPLTIIAGENSTGKTFVTKSLYTMLNSVYRNHFAEELSYKYAILESLYISFIDSLNNPAKVDLDFETNFKKFQENIDKFVSNIKNCNFEEQDDLVKLFTPVFNEFERELNTYFKGRLKLQKFRKYVDLIEDIFHRYESFKYTIFNRREVVIENISTSLEEGFKKNFQTTSLKNLITKKSKNLKLSLSTIGEIEFGYDEKIEFNFQGRGIQKVQNVENIVFFDSPVYMKIQKALQKGRMGLGSFFESNTKFLKGYPEYLDKLYGYIENEYIDKPCFINISDEISELISGGLSISKSGDIIYNDNDGNSIPLSLTAMGISNIGLIDLLIRNNTINKGSFLIMDEPEVHLHPQWQVALAGILYKIAENGANVIIATHSLDLLKAFESILKENSSEAEKIIAINKMPYDKKFTQKSELEKVQIVLDDLSRPYYNLYLKDV